MRIGYIYIVMAIVLCNMQIGRGKIQKNITMAIYVTVEFTRDAECTLTGTVTVSPCLSSDRSWNTASLLSPHTSTRLC